MVTKSKLKLALAAEKGIDFKKIKQKRKLKAVSKQNAKSATAGVSSGPIDLRDDKNGSSLEDTDDAEWDDIASDDDDEHSRLSSGDRSEEEVDSHGVGAANPLHCHLPIADRKQVDIEAVDESDTSDSSIDMEERLPKKDKSIPNDPRNLSKSRTKLEGSKPTSKGVEEGEEQDEEDDIPLSDLEDIDEDEKEDLVPYTRLTINNTAALTTSLKRISIPTGKSVPFYSHQSLASSSVTADSVPDVSDDLKRELAFYSQSLEAAKRARELLRAEGVSFSRPGDYFAEMVKDDGHMEKVRGKLVEEATAKRAAAEARKLRDLKKFGKQVQVAKLQERQKIKRETLEKIKVLKRSK
jgi:rRNA-processing protein EBP2